jgi:hypothetical protein
MPLEKCDNSKILELVSNSEQETVLLPTNEWLQPLTSIGSRPASASPA